MGIQQYRCTPDSVARGTCRRKLPAANNRTRCCNKQAPDYSTVNPELMWTRTYLPAFILLLTIAAMPCYGQPGTINTIAGGGTLTGSSANGTIATNAMLSPLSVGADISGNCYIPQPRAVRVVNTAGIINTAAGIDTLGYAGDGNPATDAEVGQCVSVVADHEGNLYIADNSFAVIRKIDAAGIITTYAGNGVRGNLGSGGLAVSCEL